MKPMRVILLVASFFPKATGATYSAYRLATKLRERGVTVTFVVDTATGRKDEEEYDGFPVRTLFLQGTGKLRKFGSLLKLLWWIRRGVLLGDYFHVQGGGHMNMLTSGLVGFFGGIPSLMKITLDGWDTPDGIRKYPWSRLSFRCFMALGAVVAMTSGQRDKCLQAGYRGLLRVIPNGVDCVRYRPANQSERQELRKRIGLGVDDVVLIYVGWVGLRKGTDVLLEVFRRLVSRNSRLKLMLVGDYLEKRKEGGLLSGLSEDVEKRLLLTGRVSNAEDYFRAADIFVFPSNQEGFGTVQIEAMACGLPCVVNDLPGISCDIYPDEETGCRIEGNRVETWVATLEKLMGDGDLRERMGRAARQRAESHFSLDSVADRYLELYGALRKQ